MISRPSTSAAVSARPWGSIEADDDVDALAAHEVRVFEHAVGLADAGSGAEINAEASGSGVSGWGGVMSRARGVGSGAGWERERR